MRGRCAERRGGRRAEAHKDRNNTDEFLGTGGEASTGTGVGTYVDGEDEPPRPIAVARSVAQQFVRLHAQNTSQRSIRRIHQF